MRTVKNGRKPKLVDVPELTPREEAQQKLPTRCKRCGGPMIRGYDDATCMYCGEYECIKVTRATDGQWPPFGIANIR